MYQVLIPDRSCEHINILPGVLSQNLRGDSCGEWLWACSPVTAGRGGGRVDARRLQKGQILPRSLVEAGTALWGFISQTPQGLGHIS